MVLASPIAAYENTLEVSNLNQLEEIISDPDGMRMQALLVRERILGPAHPDTSYYIRYRGAVYADMGHFERCITLWMYALDMQQKMLEPLSPMTQSSLLSFAELFSYMMSEGRARGGGLGGGGGIVNNNNNNHPHTEENVPNTANFKTDGSSSYADKSCVNSASRGDNIPTPSCHHNTNISNSNTTSRTMLTSLEGIGNYHSLRLRCRCLEFHRHSVQ